MIFISFSECFSKHTKENIVANITDENVNQCRVNNKESEAKYIWWKDIYAKKKS